MPLTGPSSRTRRKVRLFLTAVDVRPFDEAAAWHAGDIRQALAALRTPIGGYDALIAGHARACGDVLVTRHVRELERVDGLVVEAW
jgi:tRNA(fMet)-specific endonuclease VapC